MTLNGETAGSDFIRSQVIEDLRSGRFDRVKTRFPPEPNGYLHIGHAKAICIDFEIAAEFGGTTNLRFDDTNPVKEDVEYVDSITDDIRWLGFQWDGEVLYASDYFEQLYELAVRLVRKGRAYVDDQSAEEIRLARGTLTEPGRNSPFRDRTVEENLDLFSRMRAGEYPDGARVLRAKIDMAAGNITMRDPVLYRILHSPAHHRTGGEWCIYPMYDFAHGQSDSIEGITHSLASLEYEDHRPLYDWFLRELEIYAPRQMEFSRLSLSYTILSKRFLRRMVDEGIVSGWDDPRMPTLRGLRRRGYTSEAIRAFVDRVGVGPRVNNTVDLALLEHCLREDLNRRAPRAMGVLHPLRVVVENYPEDRVEWVTAVNNPEDPSAGTRQVPFSRVLYIEQDDFREEPPAKYYRLAPGREVRLRYGYFLTCVGVVKDESGKVVELRCTYDPATIGGSAPDGRKVKATIHWVSADHSAPAEVRLYDRLFVKENPTDTDEGADFLANLNPNSLTVLSDCRVEPELAKAQPGHICQLERLGYFCVDADSADGKLVLNRTVQLRDEWARLSSKPGG